MPTVQSTRRASTIKIEGDAPATRPGWLLGFGIFYIVLGVVAILIPWLVTLASVTFFGALLFVAGVAALIHCFQPRHWGEGGLVVELLAGVLSIVIGTILFLNAGISALVLTLLIGASFLISGLFRGCFGILHPEVPHRDMLLLSGIVNILLAAMILFQWPVSGLWVIGTFIGIDFIIYGAALLSFHSFLTKAFSR